MKNVIEISGSTGSGKTNTLNLVFEILRDGQKIFCQNCQEERFIVDNHCTNCHEQICLRCGCTDSEPCQEVCEWAAPGRCSNCVD